MAVSIEPMKEEDILTPTLQPRQTGGSLTQRLTG